MKNLNLMTVAFIGVGGYLAYSYMQKRKAKKELEEAQAIVAQQQAAKQAQAKLLAAEAQEEGQEGIDATAMAMAQSANGYSNAGGVCNCGGRYPDCRPCTDPIPSDQILQKFNKRGGGNSRTPLAIAKQQQFGSYYGADGWGSSPISTGM